MTTEARTALTRDAANNFITRLSSRQFSSMPSLFSPTARYWVLGNPSRVPWAGDMAADERLPGLSAMMNAFAEFVVDVRSLVADANKAVVEFSLRGTEPEEQGGLVYSNDVVMTFEVDAEGKIEVLREYLDNSQSLAYFEAKEKGLKKEEH